ncbi:type VI immunity family protein [Paraburkholderia sp. J41]|uniref:type VI immunity family protein n=1 Tax=Paraburkholderia sp. J41 TaxID=2805433 RepID=UPI002AC33D72|nr:type VI immunity family protein [Paraburkholderia sp. J41]
MTPKQLSDYIYDCDHIAPDSPEPNYRYVVKLVLRVTLFFRDAHLASSHNALWDCFDDYFKAFGKYLQWGWDPEPSSGKPTPWHFDERLAEDTQTAIINAKPGNGIELGFMDSFNQKYVGDYGIKCLTAPDWEQAIGRDISYLSFWVAPDCVQKGAWDAGAFPMHDFLISCCNKLNATHGYAGFALALPHEYARWEPYELELAERYYGLQIDKPISVILMTNGWEGITGVNWYTVLGEHYTRQLGGPESIRTALTDPEFRFYHLDSGGLVIRSGCEPEMAPVEKGIPSLYAAINKVVLPVRTNRIRSMGLGSNAGELRFNLRLTDLWLRRFDAPGIWPPALP